jgi:hypothetical protein
MINKLLNILSKITQFIELNERGFKNVDNGLKINT